MLTSVNQSEKVSINKLDYFLLLNIDQWQNYFLHSYRERKVLKTYDRMSSFRRNVFLLKLYMYLLVMNLN